MELFDKKHLYLEWDDYLDGKEVVYGDNIFKLKERLSEGVKGKVTKYEDGRQFDGNQCVPFLIKYDSGESLPYALVYYDPLLEIKRMFNEGRRIQVRDSNTSAWQDLIVLHEFDERLLYRIAEDNAGENFVTSRQLSQWTAQGRGEYIFLNDGNDGQEIAKRINMVIFPYTIGDADKTVPRNIRVRRWEDDDWHWPTVGYCFPEEVKNDENR